MRAVRSTCELRIQCIAVYVRRCVYAYNCSGHRYRSRCWPSCCARIAQHAHSCESKIVRASCLHAPRTCAARALWSASKTRAQAGQSRWETEYETKPSNPRRCHTVSNALIRHTQAVWHFVLAGAVHALSRMSGGICCNAVMVPEVWHRRSLTTGGLPDLRAGNETKANHQGQAPVKVSYWWHIPRGEIRK
jgi:hypothetical protein